jgi:FAD dependent oxidoreductase TIGR03364
MQKVVIIGAGIHGLAHALAAARAGWKAVVIEGDPTARGASIRNFGIFLPTGMADGLAAKAAAISGERWKEAAAGAGFPFFPCGSLFLATRQDELAVMEEFISFPAARDSEAVLLSGREAMDASPLSNPDHVIGGLFSPHECNLNPREAIARIPGWLTREFGVSFHWGSPAVSVEDNAVRCANGGQFHGDRIVVCPGADLQTLFPGHLQEIGLRRCKLQMMATQPMPGLDQGPIIASGLCLRHYPSFSRCGSLKQLAERIARETPELDRFGIHVMASQIDRPGGGLVLGDSHEYDVDISPFDKQVIDDLILRELRRLIRPPHWRIAERWSGTYVKHPHKLIHHHQIAPQCWISLAPGGAGMTLSFGLAELFWENPDLII